VEEKVAWFVSWWPRLSHDRRGEFELFHIWVDQSVQAKGIGSQLFSHLIVQAKAHYSGKDSHLRKFRLTTALTNTNAHSFYEHQGMVVTGFSEHRFGNQKQELEYALLFDEHWNIRTDITDRKKGIVDLLTET
jgi:ribosomal protein S18 acetylase RimI-like enzyme